MKLENISLAARISGERTRLIVLRADKFGVTIGGTYQDDEMVERCRPTIIAVLDERIAELDKDLRQLGVDVG